MAEFVVIGFPVGNTVIGKVVAEDDRIITIDTPVELMAVPVEGGKVQMTMVPFKFIFADASDKTVTFSKDKALFIKDLKHFPQMAEGYRSELAKMNGAAPANNAQEAKPSIIVE